MYFIWWNCIESSVNECHLLKNFSFLESSGAFLHFVNSIVMCGPSVEGNWTQVFSLVSPVFASSISVPGVWYIQQLWKFGICNYQKSLYFLWYSFIFNELNSISGGLYNCLWIVRVWNQHTHTNCVWWMHLILNRSFCVTCRIFTIEMEDTEYIPVPNIFYFI